MSATTWVSALPTLNVWRLGLIRPLGTHLSTRGRPVSGPAVRRARSNVPAPRGRPAGSHRAALRRVVTARRKATRHVQRGVFSCLLQCCGPRHVDLLSVLAYCQRFCPCWRRLLCARRSYLRAGAAWRPALSLLAPRPCLSRSLARSLSFSLAVAPPLSLALSVAAFTPPFLRPPGMLSSCRPVGRSVGQRGS